ncbi:MAG: DUF2975 domain-containing protein [Eubacterium sp.]|nr:DUF2975 domain-containing protein [Eubacterium sp.]MBR1532048.1 DUF2975 domain-containing protein [Eubacterium sp.]MBR2279016.1 DUF2975 domain-containing protein [Eubacterium sp.]
MKYSIKSANLTQIIVKICYVLLAVSVILFPILMRQKDGDAFYFVMIAEHGRYLIFPFYAVVPAGYAALICLDKLLSNIKKDIVFDSRNVKILNSISLCCIYAALVGIISYAVIALCYKSIETVILLAFGEAFMALVVRVVRDVMQKAIEIKQDNDLVV